MAANHAFLVQRMALQRQIKNAVISGDNQLAKKLNAELNAINKKINSKWISSVHPSRDAWRLLMERGVGHWRFNMTAIQVRAAVKQQIQAQRDQKLVYRGVAYLKKIK